MSRRNTWGRRAHVPFGLSGIPVCPGQGLPGYEQFSLLLWAPYSFLRPCLSSKRCRDWAWVCHPHLWNTIPKILSSLLVATLQSLYLQKPHSRCRLQPQNSFSLLNSRNTGLVFAETVSPQFTLLATMERPEFQQLSKHAVRKKMLISFQ